MRRDKIPSQAAARGQRMDSAGLAGVMLLQEPACRLTSILLPPYGPQPGHVRQLDPAVEVHPIC